jgi:hypothetical protein
MGQAVHYIFDHPVVAILIIIFVVYILYRIFNPRHKDQIVTADGVTVKESDDDADEIDEPSVLNMGLYSVYPKCPKCEKEMNNLLVISNGDSDHYGEGYAGILLCPHCHVFLAAMEP